MAVHLTLAALEMGPRESLLVQVPATAAGQPTLTLAVVARHASVAVSALATDAAHLTLAAREMGQCETSGPTMGDAEAADGGGTRGEDK